MSAFGRYPNSSVKGDARSTDVVNSETVSTKTLKLVHANSSYNLTVGSTGVISSSSAGGTYDISSSRERIVVANPGDHTFSVINVQSENVRTIRLADGAGVASEPMYVNPLSDRGEVWFGDRGAGNNRVIIADLGRLRGVGEVTFATATTPFHSFWNDEIGQVWVACDGNDYVVVIDSDTLAVLSEFTDGVLSPSYKPHDVTVTPTAAFVTWISKGVATDSILARYSTSTYTKTGQTTLAGDSHVWYSTTDSKLYVAAEGGALYKIDPTTAVPSIEGTISSTVGHGITGDSRFIYVASAPSNSSGVVYRIPISANSFAIDKTYATTPTGNLHNLMLSSDSRKLFVTRTAVLDVVVFDVDEDGNVLVNGNSPRTLYTANSAAGPMGLFRTEKYPTVLNTL